MIVTSKISVDMTQPNPGGRIYAMQGDGNTRCVELTMLSGDRPWRPPEDAQAEFTYQLPNGEKGIYNTLADGSPAVQVRGNTAQIMLVPHVLSVAGEVTAAIVLYNPQQDQLTSFPFSICVKPSRFTGAQKTEGYLRLEWLEKMLDAYIAQLVEEGAMGKSAYEIAVEHGYVGTVEQWLQSLTGTDGVTFLPQVSPDGDLSWSNDGGLPNPPAVNIRGPEGDSTAATNAAISAAASAASAQGAVERIAPELACIQEDILNKEPLHRILSAALVTGETTLTFTDPAISDDAMIYIYTNVWGVDPVNAVQSENTLTLTFAEQSQDIQVKVEVR